MSIRIESLLGLALVLVVSSLPANEFHPEFRLLDRDGEEVLTSGNPFSTLATCGECHDTAYIHESSDHAKTGIEGGPDLAGFEAWLARDAGRHVGGGPLAHRMDMTCLMCHGDMGGAGARRQAMADGEFEWANSAALTAAGIIERIDGEWRWNPWSFLPDGRLAEGLLTIRKPRDENCAQCHGQSSGTLGDPLTLDPDPALRSMTHRSGVIVSPQKIANSGLNVAGKEQLSHAFDVHADRVVGCVNCHYSLNNPVYFEQRSESRPEHLVFDPRRLSSAEYLERPLHQFARRRCESCHDAEAAHDWLPYKTGHFAALACASCHVPAVFGPAVESVDWSLVNHEGEPRVRYRNADGDPASADSLIEGFAPVMLSREMAGEPLRLAPFNLVSSWYWRAGDPARPVRADELQSVFYPGGEAHPELLKLLDQDGDGALNDQERYLDSPEAVALAAELLRHGGLQQPQLHAEAVPYPVSHNVVNGRWATRDCATCHGRESLLSAPVRLADKAPGGMAPVLAGLAGMAGSVSLQADGAAVFTPQPGRQGFYVLGLNSVPLVDVAGLLMFLGILTGVTGHALARYVAWRRRPKVAHPTRPVKLYDAYDRIWHWLQAAAILLLLFTGLVIHKPHLFGMFSFRYVVQVHNVLGFILLINAALALFYNLASGAIRRFLPEPRDFFARSFEQAMYYMRGIFAGERHPLEKTADNRLNPLQQITYLMILNILLPAQVVTGVLIWGLQRWPELANALGGLAVLAPIHTLLAWAFAAFIVMHVYLTTTGETPTAGIRSMVSGWENVEDHASENG
jgi:Ni/Fe-hydrogenase b-type cytochrome subunit